MTNEEIEQRNNIRNMLSQFRASLDRTKINLALYKDLMDISKFEEDFEQQEIRYQELYQTAKTLGIV